MTNPYAAPKTDVSILEQSDETQILRDKNTVRVPKEFIWPDRCVICNEPSGDYKLKRKLQWYPPWVSFFILLSPLIFIIIALITQKKAVANIGLCKLHQKKRKQGLMIGILGLFGSTLLIILGITTFKSIIYIGLLGFIASPIIGTVMSKTIRAAKIDKQFLWAKVPKPFLKSITSK